MKAFLKLLLPEPSEIVLFISVSLGLLILQSSRRFWEFFGGTAASTLTSQNGFDTVLSTWLTGVQDSIDPRVADFVVWVLIGSVLYVLLSYAIAAFKSTGDEVELLHYYRNPQGKSHEINVYITRLMVRASGVLGMIIWLVVFFKHINPYLTKLFFSSATSLSDPASWLWAAITVVVFAASLYIFAILARIIMLRPRIFSANEEI